MRVYEYGLLQPTQGADVAWRQLWLAHRYYNDLIAAERKRRESVAAITAEKKTDEWKAAAKAIDAAFREQCKALRAACGVYWGTYLLVEAAFETSCQTSKEPPRFKRWEGEGSLGVQIQGGMDAADIFGVDRRIRVKPVDPAAWSSPVRGERRRLSRTTLQLRVGSEGRDPVWAEWPMVMHRPLPEGARVKVAKVIVRQHAGWPRWVLQLTLETETPALKRGEPVCAVDLGWRSRKSKGLRAAMWGDYAGEQEYLVEREISDALDYADSIRSIRDQGMDAMREALVTIYPGCRQWKSPQRFVRLLRTRPLPEGVQEIVEPWYHRNRHLWQIETGVRRGALLRRRESIRIWAAALADKYSTVILEDFRLTDVIPKVRDPKAPRQRVVVAPGILRQQLISACAARGVAVVRVPCEHTTTDCHRCGHREEWDQSQLMHTCGGCGERWDQDRNAVRNLLRRASGDVVDCPPAPLATSKRAESRRKGKAVLAERKAAARFSGAD